MCPAVAEFHWQVRVYYEDTDSGGVVYYANYLRFLERARTEWMRALGFEQDELSRDEGLLFAVRSASVDYLRPARFNDLLTVSVRVVERRRASLVFDIRIACLDAESLAPRPIPEKILREIPDVD
jgi:acyl-CoA thioester hydrolase